VERITENFRRLAMQPTVQKTGNITATATAVDASKAHSAVEAWAIALKDALDQALMFTAAWMNVSDTATASVHTDFAADLSNVEQEKVLSDGSAKGIVSKKTVRGEWKRTGVLGPDYDKSDEEQRLAEEQQGLDPEDPIKPRPAQSDLQLLFLLLPTRVLRLRPFFECGALGFDCACLLSWSRLACSIAAWAFAIAFCRRSRSFAVAASSFRRSLSRCLCSLSNASAALRAALSSILRDGCFFSFARLFWSALDLVRDRCVGKSACSLNGPFDPTGRLRMTPGFRMVAAMTSGSSTSFATP
jgi:hypothetical protein